MRRHTALVRLAGIGVLTVALIACSDSTASDRDARASDAPAATATGTATATVAALATATSTPSPTPAPAPSPTATPTASPSPTATASPPASATASPTPSPTAAPATSTPAPTATPTPAPTPIPRVEGPLTPIGDRDCGAPNDFHYTAAYDGWSVYGAGAFCIYHPQSETVVAALSEIASTASAALDSVQATVGIAAGRTINIYAHESWGELAAMSWLPMWAAFGDTTGIWMPYTRVLHADPRVLLHELTHTVMFRQFPGANSLLAEGVAEWTAHEISNWAFFDAAKADSCTQSLTELAGMRPIPFECQGAAARIVEQLVNQHGGLAAYWELVQAAYADPVGAPVTVYGLTWDEIDALYR